ncbi:MAG TPA: translation initiation factor IF-2 N-terminal domain-containing protein, partial [Bacteroidales bacterium]|nr:translation initiation factor IF-2 N-terminal domain-containing protein [Bacteroidales bacterium]
MSEGITTTRLSKAAREFNIGIKTVVDFLAKKGFPIDTDPNAKLSSEMYTLLMKEFAAEKHVKEEAKKIGLQFTTHETITIEGKKTASKDREKELDELFIKNVSLEFEKKQHDAARKLKEPVQKEAAPEKAAPAPEIAKPVVLTEEVSKPAEPVEAPPAPVMAEPVAPKIEETPPPQPAPVVTPVEVAAVITEPEPVEPKAPVVEEAEPEVKSGPDLKIIGKIDLGALEKRPSKKTKTKAEKVPADAEAAPPVTPPATPVAEATAPAPEPVAEVAAPAEPAPIKEAAPVQEANFLPTERIKLEGPTILGSIVLPDPKKFEKKKPQPVASSSDENLKSKKKKRKRIKRQGEPGVQEGGEAARPAGGKPGMPRDRRYHRDIVKPEVTPEDIEKQIKETLARLSPTGKSKASKYRKAKREAVSQQMQEAMERLEESKQVIKVTEFVTANELASMLNVPVTEVISTCMALGMFVSINQRLDAETLTLVAEEFGHKVEFVSVEVQEAIRQVEPDRPEDMAERPPIVTVMGHVDHGKTKLLDFIRSTNVVAGEAGGITQHIGAYEVQRDSGKKITFLDTPGHEAFTAMRARGASITDVVIIVIASDETVMPQTREAINHALAAGVPIVFAFNKMDKPNANPEKLREELSKMNILV